MNKHLILVPYGKTENFSNLSYSCLFLKEESSNV
jgi:hypothetical protein